MSVHFISISTQELIDCIDQTEISIIDVRPVDAYNGWTLKGERRGGHVKGARSLPVKWTKYIDWIEIVRSKGILPEQTIIVYGYANSESEKVASLLARAGYNDVKIYNKFINEWSANPELPMNSLAKYSQLVYPDWLKTLKDGGAVPEFHGKNYVICHAHYRNYADYDKGHIPGAIEIDTNSLESPETWNRRTPEEIKTTLESKGINENTTVILYGRFSYPSNDDPFPGSSAGHLGAIRCAFIMMFAGIKDVKILNGGLQSWLDAGYEITKETTKTVTKATIGIQIPVRPELAVDVPEAKRMIVSNDAELVCVRSWPEYIGEVSGYNYIEKKGRIPGAVFGNCGTDAYHMENYRNLDHTTREYSEIVKIWKEVGIVPEKHNAFYCGTGWRGSEAWLNAYLMGWPRVSVFDGGWFEWSNDPENPYETGLPA
jgi:thiosulfate/3-mercaptopyruvate sulfurtransferase